MRLETDLEKIKRIAIKKRDENYRFRSYLKMLDIETEELDSIVHGIYEEVRAQIDCTKCANCCKELTTEFDKNEIKIFAKGLNMPPEKFKQKYLTPTEDEPGKFFIDALPCPFLENNLCVNYENRPESCVSFPHLHKPFFTSRLFGVVGNYSVCPIVFNVYEQLKDLLWHRNWRSRVDLLNRF